MSSVKSIKKTQSRQRSSTKQSFATTFPKGERIPIRKPVTSLQSFPAASTDLSDQLRSNLIHNVEATATRAPGDLALWEM